MSIGTPNITASSVLDEIIGNADIGGVKRTRRQSIADFAGQLRTITSLVDATDLVNEIDARAAGDEALDVRIGTAEDAIAEIAGSTIGPLLTEVDAGQTTALPAYTYDNGTAGVGATITADANGALAASYFDSVSSLSGARVWVRLEGAYNGIYDVTQIGDGSSPFILTRAVDADATDELGRHRFSVKAGTPTHGGKSYQCQQAAQEIVIGTTPLTFALAGDTSAMAQEVTDAREGEPTLVAGLRAARTRTARQNLWPDTFFRWSGGDRTARSARRRMLYSLSTGHINMTWGGDVAHEYGTGAWVYDSGSTGFMSFHVWLSEPGAEIAAGDVISLAVAVQASAGNVSFNARFFSEINETGLYDYSGGQISGDQNAVMDGSLKVLKNENLTVPADAVGLLVYLLDGAASDFECAALWCDRGPAAGDAPPLAAGRSAEALALERARKSERDVSVARAFLDRPAGPSASVVMSVTNPTTTSRSGFNGYGEVFATSGLAGDFNAFRFPALTGNAANTRLRVVVKTAAANSQELTNPIVAIGGADIDPDATDYSQIVVALRDPETGHFKTIAPSDLSAEYYIHVWAILADGSPGDIDQPGGTLANRLGSPRTYYTYNASDPLVQKPNPIAGNLPVGAEHILLTAPREDFDLSAGLRAKLQVAYPVLEDSAAAGFEAVYGRHLLRNWRSLRALGSKVRIAVIGDSWTNTGTRLVTPLLAHLETVLAVSAPGWVTANTDISLPAYGARVRTGTWTNVRSSTAAIGPDNAHASSTDLAATLQFSSVKTLTRHVLHYLQQPNGGTFTWSLAGGGATPVNTNGSLSYQTIEIVGDGALDIAITDAGTAGVVIAGDDMQSDTAGGLTLHKLGSGGAQAGHFAGASNLAAAYTALAPDIAIVMLGTNDNAADINPTAFRSNIEAIVAAVLSANPLADIFMVSPGPNGGTHAYSLAAYAEAMLATARSDGRAFLDLAAFLGSYADANARGLYSDTYHVNSDGGQVNADVIFNEMFAY